MAYKKKAFKRSKKTLSRKLYGKKPGGLPLFNSRAATKLIKSVQNRQLETKTTITNYSDGRQVAHMALFDLDSEPFITGQGVQDPTGTANNTTALNNRIGDEILAKGVRYKIFLENNERFGQVHHRFIFVKMERGAAITDIWCGRSDNKLIDDINHERVTVMMDKTFKISAPNAGANMAVAGSINYALLGSGTYGTGGPNDSVALLPGSKIVTLYIPYHKSNTYKKLIYKSATNTPKFYDYHLLYMPYVLQNTSILLDVAKINDMQKVFYFKDP